jgi:hypothetical protein
MDENELKKVAEEIAHLVIDSGRVEEGEWFIPSLGAEVFTEADERGYENATEISEMAVQLYSK